MNRAILLTSLIAASFASANAATITILPAATIADAIAERDAWLAATFGAGATALPTENFESFGYGPFTSLVTGAGVFSIAPGALPSTGFGTHNVEFTILNGSDTPFSGRYNTTPGGNNWLDSNDLTQLQLTTSLNTLYFFMTDVNDVDGTLSVQTADGTNSATFSALGPDGNLYFAGINSTGPILSVQWSNTSSHDGFGLDDFGTVRVVRPADVPEPANWLAATTGLLILALALRIRARRQPPTPDPTTSPESTTPRRRR